GPLVQFPPSDAHGCQFPLIWSCQVCQIALSVPRANTTNPPGAFKLAAGSLVHPPPRDSHRGGKAVIRSVAVCVAGSIPSNRTLLALGAKNSKFGFKPNTPP